MYNGKAKILISKIQLNFPW